MKPTFFDPDFNAHAEELRQYLPVNASLNFDSLAPALGDAEQKHIRPAIGEESFNALADYYRQCSFDSEENNNLITRLQAAVVRIAFFESFDLLSVTLTDSGLQDLNGDTRAYRYQADAARDTLGRQAYEYLQYFFDAYLASSIYISGSPARQSVLFPTYRPFFDTLAVEPDFRLFAKLLPMVSQVEHMGLTLHIGQPLAHELVCSNEGRMADPDILLYARQFVANKVMADSVMTLHAFISDDGATTRTIKAEGTNGGTNRQLADRQTRVNLQQTYRHRAEAAIFALTQYFLNHQDIFPEILAVNAANPRTSFVPQGKKTFRTF